MYYVYIYICILFNTYPLAVWVPIFVIGEAQVTTPPQKHYDTCHAKGAVDGLIDEWSPAIIL